MPKDHNLENAPLTPLGRRILVRLALLTKDGRIGIDDITRTLGVRRKFTLGMLKLKNPEGANKAEYTDVCDRLCSLLKVDHSWLFDTMDYGDTGALSFALRRRDTRGLIAPKDSLNVATAGGVQT
jgi:hypothetical protein